MRRIPAIATYADAYGETPVTTGHFNRVTNDAEGGAATRMGKGSQAHVSDAWAASMTVTMTIRDAKRAALLTGAFAKLKLDKSQTRVVIVNETELGEQVGDRTSHKVQTDSFISQSDGPDSPFRALAEVIEDYAKNPQGKAGEWLQRGYRINIHLSPHFWAEVIVPCGLEGTSDHIRFCYFPDKADADRLRAPGRHPPPKWVSITAEQIKVAAAIYADTLAHEAAAISGGGILPLLTNQVSGTPGAETPENDNAGTGCDTVPASCVQPSATPADGFPGRQHPACEKRKIQEHRVRSSGRSTVTSRGADHDRAFVDHHHAL